MGATTTKYVDCPVGDWTELVDGADYASCQIMADGVARVAIAAAKPAAATGDYIKIGQWPPLSLTLDATDKVYGQPNTRLLGGVRLAQTART